MGQTHFCTGSRYKPMNENTEYELILEKGRHEKSYWMDLWRYRELFQVLAWRDLSVRYKQTVIGVAWAVIRPVVTLVTFAIVFGSVAKLPSDGAVPYPLLVLAGMLPWAFFSTAMSEASNSLVVNQNLISKVYFPRIIVPLSTVVVALVDLCIAFVIFIMLATWYGHAFTWRLTLLPFCVVLTFFASVGPALWMTAMNVKYRDFRYIIPFIVQLGQYISPVGFSSSVIPPEWRIWFALNPIVGVIDSFRWCLLGADSAVYFPGIVFSILVTITLTLIGVRQFRRMEKSFADII